MDPAEELDNDGKDEVPAGREELLDELVLLNA